MNAREKGKGSNAYPTTSCARLATSGSLFLVMFPLPPRPVVYMSDFRVGVSRVTGSASDAEEPMLPRGEVLVKVRETVRRGGTRGTRGKGDKVKKK